MIQTLTLDNYRGFRRFELHDLGRVNLIVGTNNSGKTSILEAINLLARAADPAPLVNALYSRGEELDGLRLGDPERLDVRHLFHGRSIPVGSQFSITGQEASDRLRLHAEIAESYPNDPGGRSASLFDPGGDEWDEVVFPDTLAFILRWKGGVDEAGTYCEIDKQGGLSPGRILPSKSRNGVVRTVRMLTAEALSPATTVTLFEKVVLTADEDLVVQSLNIIDPSIERIASTGTDRWRRNGRGSFTKAGLVLRCRDNPDRIPIGSMGDGIWRLLGLTLALVNCKDGILLVDEIDTGLHYTVMEKMWKLVTVTARRLNVQVFATTHSRDCYESLAAVCRDEVTKGSEVTIQRIEPTKGRSVAYSEAEIIAAARWATEVR